MSSIIFRRSSSLGQISIASSWNFLYKKFHEEAMNICPNDDERLNIILDITYGYNGNKQFCWDTIGDLICKRLEEMNTVHTE